MQSSYLITKAQS